MRVALVAVGLVVTGSLACAAARTAESDLYSSQPLIDAGAALESGAPAASSGLFVDACPAACTDAPVSLAAASTDAALGTSTADAPFVAPVPASGPLSPWPGGSAPDLSLPSHSLNYAPSPLDNPLKGFVPWFYPGTDYANAYPHSMEWSYFALSEVMTGPTTFDWGKVDQFLYEVASRGNQGVVRFYVEYPGGTGTHPGNGIPSYLKGLVPMRMNTYWGTASPDYDNPQMIQAFTNFIQALAAKYDGDPKLAYITAGLVGLWGEWHTWPCDGQNPMLCSVDLFPTDATVNTLADAYTAAFSRTPVLIRYAMLGGGHVAKINLGFHDDSFGFKEFRSGTSQPMGDTLPASLGGWPDSFLQKELNAHGENRWVTESIGGEARPEIQSQMLSNYPGGSGQVDDIQACIELSHVTWLLDQQGISGYSATDPKVAAAVRLMGYELFVSNAYFADQISASAAFPVAVRIENRGVAPFAVPWKVLVAVLDAQGNPAQTWETGWDLRQVMPKQVRAFPDWNVGPDPTYLPFGAAGYSFELAIPAGTLKPGSYTLGMRVVHPLESLSEAQIRATGAIQAYQKYAPPKAARFANVEEAASGWLALGTVEVNP